MRYLIKGLLWFFSLALSGTILLGIATFGVFFHFWLYLNSPTSTVNESSRVSIERGMSAYNIALSLNKKGVITEPRKFYLLCRIHELGHRFEAKDPDSSRFMTKIFSKIRWLEPLQKQQLTLPPSVEIALAEMNWLWPLQAGDYAFPPFLTPTQVLERLHEGRVIQYRVTFPEGSTIWDVARILEQHGLAKKESILELVQDSNHIASLGLGFPSLEGYLFPDTYLFRRSENETEIIKTMVDQFWKHFPSSWQDRVTELGLTVHEVVILASLVESEARVDSERPLIAAVFLNRLKRNMLLQSDPTAVYDLPNFTGPVTGEHLKRQSPYNTYQKKGLPLGPICNPGIKSLKAVLYPEDVSYLYFVSNNDGTHQFSDNWKDHLQAVRNYRKKLQNGKMNN